MGEDMKNDIKYALNTILSMASDFANPQNTKALRLAGEILQAEIERLQPDPRIGKRVRMTYLSESTGTILDIGQEWITVRFDATVLRHRTGNNFVKEQVMALGIAWLENGLESIDQGD